jgi:hypothetical protein
MKKSHARIAFAWFFRKADQRNAARNRVDSRPLPKDGSLLRRNRNVSEQVAVPRSPLMGDNRPKLRQSPLTPVQRSVE